jgi:putative endonuclease
MYKVLFVYIVECADSSYYTGVTNDLQRRMLEHNFGNNKKSFTYSRRPVKLVYYTSFTDFKTAIAWEKRIKDWSRKKKYALIMGNYHQLISLSKKNFN